MKDPLIKGHPVHAILSDLPVGTTTAAVACDLMGLVTGRREWYFATQASLGLAVLSGSSAALVGLWDYLAVPHDHPARRVGAVHGFVNAGVLSLLALSFTTRQRRMRAKAGPGVFAHATTLGALMALGVSGWLGGEMVFRLGWRVTPAEYDEQLEEDLRQHGEDARIAKAHAVVQSYEEEHALLP
jgi:uncharacterized membrane protein